MTIKPTKNFEEYRTRSAELNLRLTWFNSHNFSTITIIVSIWTFATTIMLLFFRGDVKTSSTYFYFLSFLIPFLYALPVIVLYVFSYKNRDNLYQLFCQAAYIQVFYEIPSIVRKDVQNLIGWESFHPSLFDTKHINGEYRLFAIISSLLSVGSCVSFILILFHENSMLLAFILLSFGVALFLYTIFLYVKICNNTSVDKLIIEKEKAFNIFVMEAIDTGVVSSEEVSLYTKQMKKRANN